MRSNYKACYQNYDQFYLRRGKKSVVEYQRQRRNYARKFDDLLSGHISGSVLDVGCANGMLSAYLKEQGFKEVMGIDLNEQLVLQARQNVEGEFIVGDAQEFMETSNRKFDVIFLLNIIEHIQRDHLIEFMKAVAYSLKPGGFAVVRTPNMNNILSAGHLADDLTHCTGLTEQSFKQLALAAGFSEIIMLNQFCMQNFKGKVKAMINSLLHKWLFRLRGGTKPKVFYRNLYAKIRK